MMGLLLALHVTTLTFTSSADVQKPDRPRGAHGHAGSLGDSVGEPSAGRTVCKDAGEAPPSFDLSRIDGAIVKAFEIAWKRSENGFGREESVMLIVGADDGAYRAVDQGRTNESLRFRFTFRRTCNVIAIVHTHPNRVEPDPSPQDRQVARYLGLPVATLTSQGMFVYDPVEKRTIRVLGRLDWLRPEAFRQVSVAQSARGPAPSRRDREHLRSSGASRFTKE